MAPHPLTSRIITHAPLHASSSACAHAQACLLLSLCCCHHNMLFSPLSYTRARARSLGSALSCLPPTCAPHCALHACFTAAARALLPLSCLYHSLCTICMHYLLPRLTTLLRASCTACLCTLFATSRASAHCALPLTLPWTWLGTRFCRALVLPPIPLLLRAAWAGTRTAALRLCSLPSSASLCASRTRTLCGMGCTRGCSNAARCAYLIALSNIPRSCLARCARSRLRLPGCHRCAHGAHFSARLTQQQARKQGLKRARGSRLWQRAEYHICDKKTRQTWLRRMVRIAARALITQKAACENIITC